MKIMVVAAPRVADHLQHLFSSGNRYEIDRVADGEAALQRALAASYDLLLLDAAFTENVELSGVGLCRQLREAGCQTPILLLIEPSGIEPSGIEPNSPDNPLERSQGIVAAAAGADDYIAKPFEAEQLIARVEFLLHRASRGVGDRQQTEDKLQRQLDRERLIAEVTDSIRQTLDLDQILRAAVDQVRRFLQTDRVVAFRFQSHWQGVVEAESVAPGWCETLSMEIQDACLGDVYVGEYRLGRVSAIPDVDAAEVDPYHRELLHDLQVRANLVVPILQGENLWGLLIAHHCSAPRQWKAESTQLLQQVATQMGIAIQQAELYQKTREQAALIDIATDAIFVRDLAGQIVFWSQGAERLYGWQTDEAIGEPAHQLLKKREISELKVALNTTIEKGFWQGELTQSTKAGKEILVASRWTLVRDSSGRPQSLLEVNTDITDKKRLEAQFYQAQRLESLGQLAGGIAHDLGNMLTPILGIAQLLRLTHKGTDASTQKQLDLLESSAKRGVNMVKQILAFAQGSAEDATAIDMVALLQEVINVARQGFPGAIEICQDIAQLEDAHQLRQVSADSTHLHQVFMNLCVNARDAMPNGGVLTVSIDSCFVDEDIASKNLEASVGHYIVVTVADTGTGIAPEVRDRIFDPFFTTKALDKGTGLGLATVSGIVKNAGGFLRVYSEVGNGTQMKVYLPALEG